MTSRSGIGVDVHPLVESRPLVLGGVTIPFDKGLAGHSDGDVLIHAIIDGLLGSAGLGDIGTLFTPGDPAYKGIASTELLLQTVEQLRDRKWRTSYVDATILAERPVLRPFITQVRQNVAALLGVPPESVNVKATTTDGLGFIGRGDGIASLAIATIEQMG